MATIPGASGFLNAATLANVRGTPAGQSNLLGEAAAGISILDVGRLNAPRNAPGLSPSARALNKQQLSNSSEINALFSLSGGGSATVEAAQIQILGLRAGLSDSQLARSLLEEADDGSIAASENGQAIDTEA